MLVLDTEDLPAADRIEAFHAVAVGESGSCSVEQEHPEAGIRKKLEVWNFGPLTLFATRGTGMRIWRTPRHDRFDSMNTVSIITQSQGTGAFTWNGHQQHVGPDALALAHKTAGYEYAWSGTGLSVAFMVDTERLGLPEHLVQTAIPLLEHSTIAPLLLHHIRSLHRRADQLSANPGAEALGSATLELTRALIVSVADDERTRRSVAEDTLLIRVLAYIRAHLTDPGLTPHSIAVAHSISVRTLYRLCEQGGLSLEKWIIRRRLEGTRRDLTTPEHAHRTIEAIARSWGFTNPAHFSRRFHQTYGVTPRQWRRLHHNTTAFSPPDEP
ncbi:helix-turn-helix domain-containing protein [Streptomyces europaeiscabiei]|uniref:Helix-turn-helix domain-containing protein n=1 Tax=Streptomyces europaeiscabiei TaxID=146819 RepID=A0AAJ2PME1_9ACTN|nr:helix-turn-helix domain-containing protein [Streptomyces europaeiscabiei]MDX3130039.1 helix-turn-helix domain-containing protein [Streptomyces europaeiscabiei]